MRREARERGWLLFGLDLRDGGFSVVGHVDFERDVLGPRLDALGDQLGLLDGGVVLSLIRNRSFQFKHSLLHLANLRVARVLTWSF